MKTWLCFVIVGICMLVASVVLASSDLLNAKTMTGKYLAGPNNNPTAPTVEVFVVENGDATILAACDDDGANDGVYDTADTIETPSTCADISFTALEADTSDSDGTGMWYFTITETDDINLPKGEYCFHFFQSGALSADWIDCIMLDQTKYR